MVTYSFQVLVCNLFLKYVAYIFDTSQRDAVGNTVAPSLVFYDFNFFMVLFHLQDDFFLMCNNAMVYNAPETIYYKAAKKLIQSGSKLLSPVSTC